MDSLPGFTMMKQLADFTLSEWWLALSDKNQQMVALCLLRTAQPLDDSDRERFMRQAGICARLHHPKLVRFLTQGFTGDILWFATEVAEGEGLEQFIKERGPLTIRDAITLMHQVLDVVAYLHMQDVVHRSLQPQSFYVKKQDGTYKLLLTDLGSAKCFETAGFQSVTATGNRGYTIHAYTAPEALVNFKRIDPRSDIYGLGAILFFLLTGYAPYGIAEIQDQDLITTILESDPKSLGKLRPDLPLNVIAVIEQAMNRKREARFNTAEEMQAALDRLIDEDNYENNYSSSPNKSPELSSPKRETIFISYKRLDWEIYVKPLVERLRTEGFSVWVDQYLIEPGEDWLDKINETLHTCDRMILCISPEALESRHVKAEYRYFFNNGKKIFPVICREAHLPVELQAIQNHPYSQLDRLIDLLKYQKS